ncbi:AAA family ATPase [Frankia tisae]|uniref:AAA family ATPase n=1 Tax=Frankia tisae TaxID=2950104 RepID=UPI0021C23C33|nr:ATP-binding protein [Frankia tisae]
MATRLSQASLQQPVRALLQDALDSADAPAPATIGRVYLDFITVAGYRGIGASTHLRLAPGPGVNLIVGRNGSGKSSIAEGVETAFTGTNARWERQKPDRRGAWRNLHDGAQPRIEIKLAIDGDTGRSTLTRAWNGEDFNDSAGELKRPGHGTVPADEAGWVQALTDYRPFLSYLDLDRMINGSSAQLYDAVNVILGLGYLAAADGRLQAQESQLRSAENSVKDEVAGLREALWELPDEDRALRAVGALDAPRAAGLAALEELARRPAGPRPGAPQPAQRRAVLPGLRDRPGSRRRLGRTGGRADRRTAAGGQGRRGRTQRAAPGRPDGARSDPDPRTPARRVGRGLECLGRVPQAITS